MSNILPPHHIIESAKEMTQYWTCYLFIVQLRARSKLLTVPTWRARPPSAKEHYLILAIIGVAHFPILTYPNGITVLCDIMIVWYTCMYMYLDDCIRIQYFVVRPSTIKQLSNRSEGHFNSSIGVSSVASRLGTNSCCEGRDLFFIICIAFYDRPTRFSHVVQCC